MFLYNFEHTGTLLSSVNAMGYSTYRTAGLAQQVTAINIAVDINGGTLQPGDFTTLVFEPVYNTIQGTVQSGVRQTWDAYAGGNAIWWSSNPIPSAPNRDTFVSWSTIIAANPNATILSYGINQGSGNPGLTVAVDNLKLGHGTTCVIYDFEADTDSVGDGYDNCVDTANPNQADTDIDGTGDVCDGDDDNDGVADETDNCPLLSNANQANNDNDALGDACDPDDDNDGVADTADNCPLTANADQADTDGDGIGDTCDTSTKPTSKDQCKNGGYTRFNDPAFKNQGDCVSYVSRGK